MKQKNNKMFQCPVDFFYRPHVNKLLNVDNKKNLEFVEHFVYIFHKKSKTSQNA